MYLARVFLMVLVLSLTGTTVWALDLYPLWSQSFGDSASQNQAATAVDSYGQVVLTGTFTGTIDLGGGPLTSAGVEDVFLAKFDADGTHIWSQRFGDDQPQQGWSVTTDANRNVILTGPFYGTIDLGGGPLTSAGNRDIYLAKFDPDGNHIWSQRFGDSETQGSRCVVTDGTGSILLTGNFRGTIDFGGGVITSSGRTDAFLAKFDADGNHIWSGGYGGARIERGRSVAADGDRNIFMTGYFDVRVNFGGGPIISGGAEDSYLVKFDPDGVHLWSHGFGDSLSQHGESVVTDADGNVALAGYFEGTIDFGCGVLTSAGGNDAYLAKFDDQGACLWSRGFGDAEEQIARCAAMDADGNLFLTGSMAGSADFGGGPLTSAGGQDIYLAGFDAAGGHLWSQSFGDSVGQWGESVAVDDDGNVLLAGFFEGTTNFGSGPLTSAGMEDIYLAKFGLDDPTPILLSQISVVENDLGVDLSWHILTDVQHLRLEIYRAVTPRIEESQRLATLETGMSEAGFRDERVVSGETYYYWIRALDTAGEVTDYGPFSVAFAGSGVPQLLAGYPNPAKGHTTIRFYVPKPCEALLRIYGANGQEVRVLRAAELDAGTHDLLWDRTDKDGRAVAKGTYFYTISFGGAERLDGKLTVLR